MIAGLGSDLQRGWPRREYMPSAFSSLIPVLSRRTPGAGPNQKPEAKEPLPVACTGQPRGQRARWRGSEGRKERIRLSQEGREAVPTLGSVLYFIQEEPSTVSLILSSSDTNVS